MPELVLGGGRQFSRAGRKLILPSYNALGLHFGHSRATLWEKDRWLAWSLRDSLSVVQTSTLLWIWRGMYANLGCFKRGLVTAKWNILQVRCSAGASGFGHPLCPGTKFSRQENSAFKCHCTYCTFCSFAFSFVASTTSRSSKILIIYWLIKISAGKI